jgi:hypothetical protein
MVGLLPETGLVRVEVQKNRDGRRVAPFLVEPSWGEGQFNLVYKGAAGGGQKLSPTCLKVHNVWIMARAEGRSTMSQAEIVEKAGASRSSVLKAIKILVENNSMYDTGQKVNGSPVYGWGPDPADESFVKSCAQLANERSDVAGGDTEAVRVVSDPEADSDE